MLASMFPEIPEEPIRRAVEIMGSADAASGWLLENDWRELMPAQQLAGAAAVMPAAVQHQDDDDDDEDDDDEGFPGLTPLPRHADDEPASKKRKVVTQDSGSAAIEGADSYWCAFDDTTVHKGHLQLMNVRPKSLNHARIVLSTRSRKTDGLAAATRALGDVWAHCLPDKEPGYWLVPVMLHDVDDVWWQILEPHLLKKCFGDVLVFQTLTSGKAPAPGIPATKESRPAPRFDELEERANDHRALRVSYRRSGLAPRPDPKSPVACVVVLASGTPAELKRVGEYLAALFPAKAPLYFRCLRSTATADKAAVFAHDPRADPACLHPDWHASHADFRVARAALDPKIEEAPGRLFVPGHRPQPFLVERRADQQRTNDWIPLDANDEATKRA